MVLSVQVQDIQPETRYEWLLVRLELSTPDGGLNEYAGQLLNQAKQLAGGSLSDGQCRLPVAQVSAIHIRGDHQSVHRPEYIECHGKGVLPDYGAYSDKSLCHLR